MRASTIGFLAKAFRDHELLNAIDAALRVNHRRRQRDAGRPDRARAELDAARARNHGASRVWPDEQADLRSSVH